MILAAALSLALSTAVADGPWGLPSELHLKAGFGFTSYERRPKATSAGFFAEADYALRVTEWFYPKAYAGLLITGHNEDSCGGTQPCDVSNRIGFTGVKARFIAPFEWVRPYVEGGGGLSVGMIRTRVGERRDDPDQHFFGHIAVGGGLTLGRNQEVDLGFTFLLHPSRSQSAGGITLGFRLPL